MANTLKYNQGLAEKLDDIEVSIMTCPYDVNFLELTVPHLIRSLGNVSALRTLLVDWAPVSGFYATKYSRRQEDRFESICRDLVSSGVIDRVVRINYDKELMRKAVRGKFQVRHDIRGYPIYGSFYGLLTSKHKYFLHFDSDMFIYKGLGEHWIIRAISVLDSNADVAAVMPRGGPPTSDITIYQDKNTFSVDDRGFYSFSTFSSRLFLVDVERFWSLHPMKPLWLGRRDQLRSLWDGQGKALSWESMVSKALSERNLLRADLFSTDAWSLHPPTKDETYLRYLPDIIDAIEAGRYPPEQVGQYDLDMHYWVPFLNSYYD
jgi:hypothetical protein